MRILVLPLALLFAACLYVPFPRAAEYLADAFRRVYLRFLAPFTRKSGRRDETLALVLFLLLTGGVCQLIGGLHVLLGGLVMAPVLCTYAMFPEAAAIKDQLDRGVYARDIGEYDARVRSACAAFGPSFTSDMAAPLLLIALGTPLHMGLALGGAYFAARVLSDECPAARRVVMLCVRPAWAVMRFLLHLCSGVVGRSPFQAHGDTARELLLSVLGIAGTAEDTHTPVSGDIAQAIFLCMFCTVLLTLMLCVALFSFC